MPVALQGSLRFGEIGAGRKLTAASCGETEGKKEGKQGDWKEERRIKENLKKVGDTYIRR